MPHLLIVLAALAVVAVIVYAVPVPARLFALKYIAYGVLAIAAIYFVLKAAGIA